MATTHRSLRTILWLIGCVALVGAAAHLAVGGGFPRTIGRFSGNRPDTTVAFTQTRYTSNSGSSWTYYAESFTISNFDSTRRYFVRIWNGNSSGQNRVSQVSVLINGKEFMNASDVTTSVGSCTKIVEPAASTTMQVGVKGALNSYIDLDMVSTNNPSYSIYGPETFSRSRPKTASPSTPKRWRQDRRNWPPGRSSSTMAPPMARSAAAA